MHERSIKVVKKDLVNKVKVIVALPGVADEIHLNTVEVIDNWISERRENSRLEKVFSTASILAWQSPHPSIQYDWNKEQKVRAGAEDRDSVLRAIRFDPSERPKKPAKGERYEFDLQRDEGVEDRRGHPRDDRFI